MAALVGDCMRQQEAAGAFEDLRSRSGSTVPPGTPGSLADGPAPPPVGYGQESSTGGEDTAAPPKPRAVSGRRAGVAGDGAAAATPGGKAAVGGGGSGAGSRPVSGKRPGSGREGRPVSGRQGTLAANPKPRPRSGRPGSGSPSWAKEAAPAKEPLKEPPGNFLGTRAKAGVAR
mmetsp:Transcript_47675/g.152808  ORF Transcript_47675/g.152808 Transcript_47675/m.152808 type:complete len:174 (-) Transcript_47675:67-588(-)